MGQQLALPEASTGWEDSISPCGLYRWFLQSPAVPGTAIVCFVLCNPSAATKSKTDRTTESCLRLARAQGAGQVVLVNLFAYRATHPRDVQRVIENEGIERAVGPGNDRHIYNAVKQAGGGAYHLTRSLVEQGAVDELAQGIAEQHFMRRKEPLDVILPTVDVSPKRGTA